MSEMFEQQMLRVFVCIGLDELVNNAHLQQWQSSLCFLAWGPQNVEQYSRKSCREQYPVSDAALDLDLQCLTGCHAPRAPMCFIQIIFPSSIQGRTRGSVISPCGQLPFPHHPPDRYSCPLTTNEYLNVSYAPSFPLFVSQLPTNLQ
jgi:hypothetical protein